jgi:hypothetical protein
VAHRITKQLPIKQMVSESRIMWGKRRDIIVRDLSPFDAEPPGSALAGAEITALHAFYSSITVRFPTLRATSGA